MFPKQHIIINFIVSLILLLVLKPFYVLIFFLASFLIDIDHYFYYIFEKKNFSLGKAYRWHTLNKARIKKMSPEERKIHYKFILIFHGIEPLLILILLSKFYPIIFFIFLGFTAHLIEDLFEHIPLGLFKKKFFLSYSIYKHFK
ncbi:MAG: hypothetical protein ABIG37_01630 [Nanoarchaeota archaeon]|nr:hypothetical protein [Nanoarchaeota archaeon]